MIEFYVDFRFVAIENNPHYRRGHARLWDGSTRLAEGRQQPNGGFIATEASAEDEGKRGPRHGIHSSPVSQFDFLQGWQ